MTRVLGAVLAGGAARRFGADKALALIDGVALIDHVLARLAPQVAAVVVCGREHGAWRSLADVPAAGLGPLGGLCAALLHARAQRFDAVLSAGCDIAGLPRDLAARLAGDGSACAEGCPIVGWWPATLAGPLFDRLAAGGERSLRGWAKACGAREVACPAFANINTPADLARAQAALM